VVTREDPEGPDGCGVEFVVGAAVERGAGMLLGDAVMLMGAAVGAVGPAEGEYEGGAEGEGVTGMSLSWSAVTAPEVSAT